MDITAWIHGLLSKVFRSRKTELEKWKQLSEEGKKLREEIERLCERPKEPPSGHQ